MAPRLGKCGALRMECLRGVVVPGFLPRMRRAVGMRGALDSPRKSGQKCGSAVEVVNGSFAGTWNAVSAPSSESAVAASSRRGRKTLNDTRRHPSSTRPTFIHFDIHPTHSGPPPTHFMYGTPYTVLYIPYYIYPRGNQLLGPSPITETGDSRGCNGVREIMVVLILENF